MPPSREKESIVLHRVLHCLTVLVLGSVEVSKAMWTKWTNHGIGYWWVRTDGFSTGGGYLETLLDSAAALAIVVISVQTLLLLTDELPRGIALTKITHAVVTVILSLLALADLALFICAGGARLSLPLVLFALGEVEYVISVVRPWLRIGVVGLFVTSSTIVLLIKLLTAAVSRAPERRVPWHFKCLLLAICIGKIRFSLRTSAGPGGDLLSQLAIDAVSMLHGTLPDKVQEDILVSHYVHRFQNYSSFPPLLLVHIEAASADLYRMSRALDCVATPYMCRVANRDDVIAMPMHVPVPMTIKTAWEALCGMTPALTSDFREQGSALRRQCLPHILSTCCGYWSILVKTDTELPDLPRRVFGFDEVIVAPNSSDLLHALHERLGELGALSGERPVFVYYYADEAHAPYTKDRVLQSERGYSDHAGEDIFLALHRQSDAVVEKLTGFWPPKAVDGKWERKHGLVIYFGDHGEELQGDAPPHGNLVSSTVTEVHLQVELRSFANRSVERGLRRPADIHSTLLDVVGVGTFGKLHIGRSLFQKSHTTTSSASFYRPSELVAVRFQHQSKVYSAEFFNGHDGWALRRLSTVPPNLTEDKSGDEDFSDENVQVRRAARQALDEALQAHAEINRLLTTSNIHAAWLMAKIAAAAAKAREAARAVARAAKALLGGMLLTGGSVTEDL